ncbi:MULTISPECIES: hypothetical protein [Cupriavidus]
MATKRSVRQRTVLLLAQLPPRQQALLFFVLAMGCNFIAFASLFLGRNVAISAGVTALASAGTYTCFTRGWARWEARPAQQSPAQGGA